MKSLSALAKHIGCYDKWYRLDEGFTKVVKW